MAIRKSLIIGAMIAALFTGSAGLANARLAAILGR
jgi:hypothetical protein